MERVQAFATSYEPQATGIRSLSFSLLHLALISLIAACGDSEIKPQTVYRLTSVGSLPAHPGASLTAYGRFPNAVTLVLVFAEAPTNPIPLSVTPVLGGLQFSLPTTVVAGEPTLKFTWNEPDAEGKTQLNTKVQVSPKIEAATLQGATLRLSGLGWPTTPQGLAQTQTRLEVAGQSYTPGLEGNALTLTLPSNQGYGALNLQLWVNQQASNLYPLLHQAGAAEGKVALPATQVNGQPLQGIQIQKRLDLALRRNTLLVYHQPNALNGWDVLGLQSRQVLDLTGTNVTRLVFQEAIQAERARTVLAQVSGVDRVEFEPLVQVQGSAPTYLALPKGSNLDTPAPHAQAPASQWHLPLMGIPQAWDHTQGDGITVAVVDTGVLLNHPDLQANLLPGYDFVDNDATPSDSAGHGTHVAGLLGANGTVLGVAPKVKILPIRVLSGLAGGSIFTVAEGILWAANLIPDLPNPYPAQVINLSLGTGEYSEVLAQAIQAVRQQGVLVVAAAGNDGTPSLSYPAALPGVVAVTALAGPLSAYQPFYASYGLGIGLTAYGGDTTQDQDGNGVLDGLLSTDRDNSGQPTHALRMGTSMAAPLVSGLAALALGSGTPPALLRSTLAQTAADLGVMGYDTRFGYGLATGRTATLSQPRIYVLALSTPARTPPNPAPKRQLRAYSLVQSDLSFRLNHLPPGENLMVLAASDQDGDRVVGEAGELVSQAVALAPSGGQIAALPTLNLSPSDGAQATLVYE